MTLHSELVTLDALALAFSHVSLTNSALAAAPIEQLKKVADSLSKRLTYLLEPISPIEVDADQCVVQLRLQSTPARRQRHPVLRIAGCAKVANSACAAIKSNPAARGTLLPPR